MKMSVKPGLFWIIFTLGFNVKLFLEDGGGDIFSHMTKLAELYFFEKKL